MTNKVTKLYDGTVTILFNELARNRYVIQETGKSPVGVTTVLGLLNKPALLTWPLYEGIAWLKQHPGDYEGASKAYLTKSDSGKSIGKIIHSAVEGILNFDLEPTNELPSIPPEIDKAITAFLKWQDEIDPKILGVERIVYSKKHDFAGTYDSMLEIDGKPILCDLKTTNASRTAPLGIYPEMFLQLGAYSLAHHEENPLEQIEDLMIIRIDKNGSLNTLRASEVGLGVPDCEQAFLNLLKVYRVMTPLSKTLSEKKT